MLLLASFLLGAAAASPPPVLVPAPVQVTATPSRQEVTVGEPFTLEVEATGPAGTRFTFPAEASTDAFELRAITALPAASPEPRPGVQRYEAAVFALADVTVPPVSVRYRLPDGTEGEAASEPLVLKVASLLPKDPQQQKLADIRGPRPVGVAAVFWIVLAALAALLAVLATWLVRRRRKTGAAVITAVPERPPDVEALQALDGLEVSGLLARGEHRLFYIRLTAIAKRYLERRLEAPVLEMTTAETVAFLRAHAHGADLLPAMRDLAAAADQVKFARGAGLAQEAERHLAAVRTLIPALESRLRPPAAASAPEGKAA
jgi:hypothetical protein